jgi:hypothetical protein
MKPNATNIVSRLKSVVLGGQEIGIFRVASYRLYSLDGARKVASAEWIDADDDHAAIEAAKEKLGGDFEVWQGRRLVTRLDGKRGPLN